MTDVWRMVISQYVFSGRFRFKKKYFISLTSVRVSKSMVFFLNQLQNCPVIV